MTRRRETGSSLANMARYLLSDDCKPVEHNALGGTLRIERVHDMETLTTIFHSCQNSDKLHDQRDTVDLRNLSVNIDIRDTLARSEQIGHYFSVLVGDSISKRIQSLCELKILFVQHTHIM